MTSLKRLAGVKSLLKQSKFFKKNYLRV